MTSTGEAAEVKVPAEDVAPVEVVPATEEPKEVEKPVKEKKPRAPREKKPRQSKVASHPPYFQVILFVDGLIVLILIVSSEDSDEL